MAKSKKIAIVVAAIALIAVIGVVGSTLAYFTDNDTRTNTFTMGNVKGDLEERTDNGEQPIQGGDITFNDVTPNATLSKVPFMKLDSNSSDAYARIKLTWDTTGLNETQAAKINALELQINPKWVLGDDGYYYYQDKLTKEDGKNVTEPIFTEVKIPETWGNEMSNITFKLKIDGYFIQANNVKVIEDAVKAGQPIRTWGVGDDAFVAPESTQTPTE